MLASNTPEVEVVRATAESGVAGGSTVLSASGYVVAHHKISVNSKVTGRVAWIGVEKGDKVKEARFSSASKTRNSALFMSSPAPHGKARRLAWPRPSMARVPKRFSRQITI